MIPTLPFPLSNIIVLAAMILISIPIVVVGPFDRSKKIVDWFVRLWMLITMDVTGVEAPEELIEQIPGDGPYIIMSNHQSHMDVVVLIGKFSTTPKFVAKKELLFVPFFGVSAWLAGHVFINRRNRKKAIASLEKAGQKIREGTTVLVFPEGTRFDDARNRLGEFKKGGFMLALKAGVPILPVGIAGTAMRMPRTAYTAFPGPVSFCIGDPIPTEGLTEKDRDALMETTRAAILEQKTRAFEALEAYTL